MIDLHTHTLLSDGVLLPMELARRMEEIGYKVIAITDHVDASNIDWVIPKIVKASKAINEGMSIRVIPGAELTHVPPQSIANMAEKARELGAKLVIAHGETIVEPVMRGTNRSAVEAGVDILAHPGLIDEEVIALAKEKGVCLELSGRKGHSLTNGHVARLAAQCGAKLVFGSDAHTPADLLTRGFPEKILQGAGLGNEETETLFKEMERVGKE